MLKTFTTAPKSILAARVLSRNLYTTPVVADQHWREDHGLPSNPNSFGPLTNLPDYSYVDGRTTPLGTNQKKRMLYQQEIAKKMVAGLKELAYAKERHAKLQNEKVADKKRQLENKLKPKGHLLLKKDK